MAKKTLKQRMKEKKAKIAERSSGGGNIIYLKEGTKRVRPLFVGEETDFLFEARYFYLGKDIGGFISPATFGEPCPAMEKYQELKENDPDEAKKMVPKTSYFLAVAVYEDEKGKKLDQRDSGKLVKITNGLAQDIIDLFLDEDEWGDPTDPKNGYDIKLIRTGTGQFDTEYSVNPCKNSPAPKEYSKKVDLEAMIREEVPSYEDIEGKLSDFLGDSSEEAPKKKKFKKKKKKSDA